MEKILLRTNQRFYGYREESMDQIYYQQDISNEVFVQRFTKQGFYLYVHVLEDLIVPISTNSTVSIFPEMIYKFTAPYSCSQLLLL